jgi:hypothetical protein
MWWLGRSGAWNRRTIHIELLEAVCLDTNGGRGMTTMILLCLQTITARERLGAVLHCVFCTTFTKHFLLTARIIFQEFESRGWCEL